MKPREHIDPFLHVIRTSIRTARMHLDEDDKEGARILGDLENARFALYRAFDAKDRTMALGWLSACRVSVIEIDTYKPSEEIRAITKVILDALTVIEGEAE